MKSNISSSSVNTYTTVFASETPFEKKKTNSNCSASRIRTEMFRKQNSFSEMFCNARISCPLNWYALSANLYGWNHQCDTNGNKDNTLQLKQFKINWTLIWNAKRTHQQIQYVINLVHNWNRWLKSECIDAIYVCGAPFSSGTVYNRYIGFIAIWYMRTNANLLANAI